MVKNDFRINFIKRRRLGLFCLMLCFLFSFIYFIYFYDDTGMHYMYLQLLCFTLFDQCKDMQVELACLMCVVGICFVV